MATKTITISGDDKDELIAEAQAVLEMLGAEAPEAEAEEASGDDDEDLTGDGDTEEEVSEEDALREKVKEHISKLAKKTGGADKIRAALKASKSSDGKLSGVTDKNMKVLAKALGVK